MAKHSKTLQANQFILNNPEKTLEEDLIMKLAQQDPELDFLCPLSRALYLLKNNSCEQHEAKDALQNCWLIDESDIHKEDTWEQGDNIEAKEVVEHSIQAHLGGEIYMIRFLSEADLLFCSDEYRHLLTEVNLLDILTKPHLADAFNNPARLSALIASHVKPPIGRPEGEDEPLCEISHQLVSINGYAVEGPKMYSGYHHVEIEDFNTLWDKHLRPDYLNWLHALNEQLAIKLGLNKSTTTESNKGFKTTKPSPKPYWLRDDIDVEGSWIDSETISKSYSCGQRLCAHNAPYFIALGSGEDWFPAIYSEDEEIANTSTNDFPLTHPPMLKIEIFPKSKEFPEAFERLRPYLLRLAEIATDS